MLRHKRILQFAFPKNGEPLCSGPEWTLTQNQRTDMAHFHTVVTATLGRARGTLFSEEKEMALACAATINGTEYDRQQFVITINDIGKTLFCAGFPCLTVTGIDATNNSVIVTYSEIVDLCEPGTCPWGDS